MVSDGKIEDSSDCLRYSFEKEIIDDMGKVCNAMLMILHNANRNTIDFKLYSPDNHV